MFDNDTVDKKSLNCIVLDVWRTEDVVKLLVGYDAYTGFEGREIISLSFHKYLLYKKALLVTKGDRLILKYAGGTLQDIVLDN